MCFLKGFSPVYTPPDRRGNLAEPAANMTFLSVTALRGRRRNRQAVLEVDGCNWCRRREGLPGIARTGVFGWHIRRPSLVLQFQLPAFYTLS